MGYFIIFALGVLSLIGSIHLFSTSMKMIKTGTRTTAFVERLDEERGSKGKYTYRPIFKFTTVTGKEIHYPYTIASSPPDWELGEITPLVYQLDDPENPLVLSYFGAFGWAAILLAVAVALLIISGGYYLFGFYMKQFPL